MSAVDATESETPEGPSEGPRLLEELVEAMRALLGVVDGAETDDEALLAAWRRCEALSERFRAESESLDDLDDEARAEVRRHLSTAARLNAIASHLVQRESERVGAELLRLRRARRTLADQVDRGARRGGSVDLEG